MPRDAEAVDAELRSSELFRFPLLSRALIVQRQLDGLDESEQARIVRHALALTRHDYPGLRRVGGALPVINSIGSEPFRRERATTAVTYTSLLPAHATGDPQPHAEIGVGGSTSP